MPFTVFLLSHSIFCDSVIISFEYVVDAVSFFIIYLSAHLHGKMQLDLQMPNGCFYKHLGIWNLLLSSNKYWIWATSHFMMEQTVQLVYVYIG